MEVFTVTDTAMGSTMVTSAVLGVHVPLLIVQRKMYVPGKVAVAVDEPDVSALKLVVPGPETWLHNPVPMDGVLPPSGALVSAPQRYWVPPTVAVVGVA